MLNAEFKDSKGAYILCSNVTSAAYNTIRKH